MDMDVRVLALKRWNLPQTESIYEKWKKSEFKYGDYVSFQQFHFLDVAAVNIQQGETPFTAAYKVSQDMRYNHHCNNQDVYIQQSITLLGQSDEFWKRDAKVLYVSMLQLSDQMPVDLSALEKAIDAAFCARKIAPTEWTLYYALDFCDIVLFARDIPIDTYHDVLWSLAPVRSNALAYIRNTATIYTINYDFLMQRFDCFAENQDIMTTKDNYHLNLSVSLSIQSTAVWDQFRKKLECYNPVEVRTPGRYDVTLLINNLSLQQGLQVIYWLDSLCSADRNEVFGCYEILPLARPWTDIEQGTPAKLETDFYNVACNMLNALYEQYSKVLWNKKEPLWGYAAEIKRSLLALLKSGFAEEFVISVFQSFAAYLRVVIDAKNSKHWDDLYAFQQEYFSGISMLVHSTMHSEKQFIQAPAFNATLCDIPPKLLAFYASMAYQATKALNDEEGRTFSFLFVPGFRQDIYVRPLAKRWEKTHSLYIINLTEKQFYTPISVVQVMCHEIAHYVGNVSRKRETRAKCMLESISAYLLLNTMPLLPAKEEISEENWKLVNSLSTALTEVVLNEYRNRSQKKGTRQYYLNDLGDYITEYNYLIKLFQTPSFVENLRERLSKALENEDISSILDKQDATLHTQMLHMLYADPNTREAALDIIAGSIISKIQMELDKWEEENSIDNANADKRLKKYFNYCEIIFQAFSEAYADLKMLQLLGLEKQAEKYENMLMANSDYRLHGEHDHQVRLRYNAICKVLKMDIINQEDWGYSKCDEMEQNCLDFATYRLADYLSECRTYTPKAPHLANAVSLLHTTNAQDLFNSVRSAIVEYRKNLCEDFGQIAPLPTPLTPSSQPSK